MTRKFKGKAYWRSIATNFISLHDVLKNLVAKMFSKIIIFSLEIFRLGMPLLVFQNLVNQKDIFFRNRYISVFFNTFLKPL